MSRTYSSLMPTLRALSALLAVGLPTAALADVYRCTTADGNDGIDSMYLAKGRFWRSLRRMMPAWRRRSFLRFLKKCEGFEPMLLQPFEALLHILGSDYP
jgi:hypothetical protein